MISIDALHDHKRQLAVTWKSSPSDLDKEMIAAIWNLMLEDGSNIEHQLVDSNYAIICN